MDAIAKISSSEVIEVHRRVLLTRETREVEFKTCYFVPNYVNVSTHTFLRLWQESVSGVKAEETNETEGKEYEDDEVQNEVK